MKLPRKKLRAVELYSRNTPFKQKIVQSKLTYIRNPKHRREEND